jgi:peptidoglycan/xylan/chitin deacetylase (PgdA/CDA1 family)
MANPSTTRGGPSLKNRLLHLAHNLGALRAGRALWQRSLTVLNYHRIDDPTQPGFDSFRPNVSATASEFARQMAYVSKWFHVISLSELVAWLDGRQELPPYAALITFDDGYLDNYTTAFPILQKYRLPAIIFLTTGHIGTDRPFYWDLAAYCFSHTRHTQLLFPNGNLVRFSNPQEREDACREWVESLKVMPENEKQRWVNRLPDALEVSIPSGHFKRLMMNWDQVREMHNAGIEFGAHTVDHPILTRVSFEEACRQIRASKARVEEEIGIDVLGFAYPNGQVVDVDPRIEQAVADAGIRAAFTLMHGPSSHREVRQNPYAIRRIFISHRHSLPGFAARLHPLYRYSVW